MLLEKAKLVKDLEGKWNKLTLTKALKAKPSLNLENLNHETASTN